MENAIESRINLDIDIVVTWCICIKEFIELQLLIQTPRCATFVYCNPACIRKIKKIPYFDRNLRGHLSIPVVVITSCLSAK